MRVKTNFFLSYIYGTVSKENIINLLKFAKQGLPNASNLQIVTLSRETIPNLTSGKIIATLLYY